MCRSNWNDSAVMCLFHTTYLKSSKQIRFSLWMNNTDRFNINAQSSEQVDHLWTDVPAWCCMWTQLSTEEGHLQHICMANTQTSTCWIMWGDLKQQFSSRLTFGPVFNRRQVFLTGLNNNNNRCVIYALTDILLHKLNRFICINANFDKVKLRFTSQELTKIRNL